MSTAVFALSLVWCLLALVGLAINLSALQEAKKDVDYTYRWSHRQTRLLMAKGHVRRERVRVVIQASFLAIGISSLLTTTLPIRIVAPIAFMIAAVGMVINSAADFLVRKQVGELIVKQEQELEQMKNGGGG